ncbi:caspase domain-containing protein [Candidatus Latescibacterota bacterium]
MKSWLCVAVLIGALDLQVAHGDMTITVSEPAVTEGQTISHASAVLRIKGEVTTALELQEVTLNGNSVALGARDLVVEAMDDFDEELEEKGTPFQGVVQLQAGENSVVVLARAADGTEATLRFKVDVEQSSMAGTAYALIVGVNDYSDERISDLRFAEPDAQAVMEALTDPQYGIVRPENVRMLTGSEATYRNVAMALEEQLVRKATKAEDMVFFYFAGHGAEGPHVSRGAAYYLVPHDADVRSLMSTAIEKGRLQFLWGAIGAGRKVFITDACHSGGLQDMKVLTADGMETVEGFVTLAAAKADQRSWELPRLGHGIFTYALAQGLRGGADANGDGFVSAQELGAYLKTEVAKLAAEVGADQAPIVDLVPGADQVLIGTSGGQALPPWTPSPSAMATPIGGPIQVSLRFQEQGQKPKIVVAVRDEEGDEKLGGIAATAVMNRFMEVSDAFRFVEPGAIAATLDGEQAALAYSDAPGDLAAVARAVAADLILTGTIRSEASGAAAEELLGTTVKSYQSHLNARVIYANTGEVVQARNVQKPGMHLNPEMARRQAVEQAGAELADQIMGPVMERWAELRRERPNGLMTLKNVSDYDLLAALEEGLAGLEPAVRELSWRSFADGTAAYEFETTAKPADVAELLKQKGLPGLRVAKVKATRSRLSFVVTQ